MINPILKDVSLAAIVRDEKMNPAGGIEKWLEFTLPFVERAVIVDTGSTDGTREILEEYAGKYPRMKVFHHKWRGFDEARNFSLRRVKSKFAFVLDADEILSSEAGTTQAYSNLAKFMNEDGANAYHFPFRHIQFPNEDSPFCGAHNPRLFLNKKVHYTGDSGETLSCMYGRSYITDEDSIYIAHFLPKYEAKQSKFRSWYGTKSFMTVSPTKSAKQYGLKEYNPRREEFKL